MQFLTQQLSYGFGSATFAVVQDQLAFLPLTEMTGVEMPVQGDETNA
jgi:hypothetical protein